MNGYEKEINSREEQKNRIRERYKGVDRSELEFIPAKPKEKLFEDTTEKRVCAYCRVSTDDVNQTSSYELQKNHYEDQQASQSVYEETEKNSEVDDLAEKNIVSKFDLSGYEVVRAQFFSTRLDPAMTISDGQLTFNTACLKKFEDVEYVEILFNSIEKIIAVRPCEKDNVNAVRWGTIRKGKWAVLPKSCRGFSQPLYELMDWNGDCKYRFRGQYSKSADEQIFLFNLEEPEIIQQEIMEKPLIDEKVEMSGQTEKEETETIEKEQKFRQKEYRTLYPKTWAGHFGCAAENIVLLERVAYYGEWDVLRPAKAVEGMDIISEDLLNRLNEQAQGMIDRMRCAV